MRQCTLTVLGALVAIAFAGSALATETTPNSSPAETTTETAALQGDATSATAAPTVKEKVASRKIDKVAKGKKKKRKKRRSHIQAR